MALAHLLRKDEAYKEFFLGRSLKGEFVLMDNGVVETGIPMAIETLLLLAKEIKATEVILPDMIRERTMTLRLGEDAINKWYGECMLMAVPQGNCADVWCNCVKEMLFWPIKAIGISRFTNGYFSSRLEALQAVPKLIDSNLDIHLLGCPGNRSEILAIDKAFPGRIRGIDSGIAAIYTQAGMFMEDEQPKPVLDLDFSGDTLDMDMLKMNITYWKGLCGGAS